MKKLLFTLLTFTALSHAQYVPFTVRDGILASYDAVAGAFNMAAYAKAVETRNFQHPTVIRYENLSYDCQLNSKAWSEPGNFLIERILKIDLKNPKQVAALGLVGSVMTIAAVKTISLGIDWSVCYCIGRPK